MDEGAITAETVEQACHERDFEKLRQWSKHDRLAELFPEETPLHAVARNDDAEGIGALVAYGFADVIDRFDDTGYTALHCAVSGNHVRATTVLIDSGANVNAHFEPMIGETPLDFAIIHGSPEIAHRLLEAGADPTIRTWMQLNAMDRVEELIKHRLYDLLRWCERTGADFSDFEERQEPGPRRPAEVLPLFPDLPADEPREPEPEKKDRVTDDELNELRFLLHRMKTWKRIL